MARPLRNMSDFKIETMQVIGKAAPTKDGKARWKCLCICGKTYEATGTHLRAGNGQSCGCLKGDRISKKNSRHGLTGTKEHKAWDSMIQRCTNKNDKDFNRYGGRGIKVCESWIKSFEEFLSNMGNAPSKKHSLDRIDVDGNYEPSNCRWADAKTQASNKRNSVYADNEKISLLWDRFGSSPIYQRALWRMKHKGMSMADAVFQPAGARLT